MCAWERGDRASTKRRVNGAQIIPATAPGVRHSQFAGGDVEMPCCLL